MDRYVVYVLNIDGHPLMPTERRGHVRKLLNSQKAKVIKRCPFTIQLLYETTEFTQELVLGVDTGSDKVGFSVIGNGKELYASELELRNDIVELLSTRRESRRSRRGRKTRYRKARWQNRKNKKEGWIAPSVECKIQAHLKEIEKLHKILPMTLQRIEIANFDIQKIKNPDISGVEYQQGEMAGWNVREYVLWRDGHTCQCCKGKTKDKILETHHIESRKVGGNAPNNLITLCKTCHGRYHKGEIKLPSNIKRGMKFNDAAFMNIMKNALIQRLKEIYPNVELTYGYITKSERITHGLPKAHHVDARCIAGGASAVPLGYFYRQKKVRNHNRQIHKMKINKGGKRKLNQAQRFVKGFQLFDKVEFENKECFIFGRRSSGYFDLRTLDGEKVHASASHKKLKLLEKRTSTLIEICRPKFIGDNNQNN